MTSIFEGQPPQNKAEIPIKTRGPIKNHFNYAAVNEMLLQKRHFYSHDESMCLDHFAYIYLKKTTKCREI